MATHVTQRFRTSLKAKMSRAMFLHHVSTQQVRTNFKPTRRMAPTFPTKVLNGHMPNNMCSANCYRRVSVLHHASEWQVFTVLQQTPQALVLPPSAALPKKEEASFSASRLMSKRRSVIHDPVVLRGQKCHTLPLHKDCWLPRQQKKHAIMCNGGLLCNPHIGTSIPEACSLHCVSALQLFEVRSKRPKQVYCRPTAEALPTQLK